MNKLPQLFLLWVHIISILICYIPGSRVALLFLWVSATDFFLLEKSRKTSRFSKNNRHRIKILKKQHTIPADVLPNASEDLFLNEIANNIGDFCTLITSGRRPAQIFFLFSGRRPAQISFLKRRAVDLHRLLP